MRIHHTHTRAATLAIGAALALGACKDSNVPFYTAPTAVPNSPAGVQNALSGLFAASRNDIGTVVVTIGAGYSRDGAVFTNTEPRTVTYPLGVVATPNTSGAIWPQEYQNILQGQQILATIPNVTPAYADAQAASLTGVVQTLIAYNYLLLAEAHDTLGIAILPSTQSGITAPPAYCLRDALAYIVALLDSANANLTTAGATLAPVKVPVGFSSVYQSSAPSTQLGSFASFNRALAAKVNLELAYAKARATAGGAPTPASPGSPDQPTLAAALADLTSSAMFSPAALAPTPSGQFKPDAYNVMHDFSAQSGDLVNPIQGAIGTEAQLNDFVAEVDTVNDLRWKAKFIKNPNPVQQQFYNPVASKYLYFMSSSPGSPIPILREENLVLYHAQILIGQGAANYAAALNDVNAVRTTVGGLAALPPATASSYASIRDALMKEQRISTTWESSVDRTLAIRMYGLQATADTTWLHEDPNVTTGDVHTTVNPIPVTEINGRGGTYTTSCP